MKSLFARGPYDVKIKEGIILHCAAMDSLDISRARAAADALLQDLVQSHVTLDMLGFAGGDTLDLSEDHVRRAVHETLFVAELGAAKITGWTGFCDRDTGKDIACTPDNIRATLRGVFVVANTFWRETIQHHMELLSAKKECATGAHGTQPPVPVAPIAMAAPATSCPAPAAARD